MPQKEKLIFHTPRRLVGWSVENVLLLSSSRAGTSVCVLILFYYSNTFDAGYSIARGVMVRVGFPTVVRERKMVEKISNEP